VLKFKVKFMDAICMRYGCKLKGIPKGGPKKILKKGGLKSWKTAQKHK